MRANHIFISCVCVCCVMQVDRSAAYAARWVAKSLVKAGLCRRVLVQVAYAIGIAKPLSLFVEDYGTGKVSKDELIAIINKNFDLRPGVIVKCVGFLSIYYFEIFMNMANFRDLDLKKPIYNSTAKYGHFGRPGYTWEVPKELVL